MNPTERTVRVLSLVGAAALGVGGAWLLRPASTPPQMPMLAERACTNLDVEASAKGNTEDLLRATFHAVGWTPSFTWR